MNEPVNRKRRHRKIRPLTVLAAFLAALTVFLFFTFVPIDLTGYRPQIKSLIESRINGTVDAERLTLHILPYPNIRLKEFSLSSGGEVVLRAQTVKMGFSALPLVFKRLDIKRLVVEGADILVRRYSDGTINLQKIPKKRVLRIGIRNFKLMEGWLKFIDEMAPEGPAVMDMERVKAYMNRTSRGLTYSAAGRLLPGTVFTISGEATGDKDTTRLSGTLSVADLRIKTLHPYVGKDEHLDGVSVDGILAADLDYSFSGRFPSIESGIIKGKVLSREAELRLAAFANRPIYASEGTSFVDIAWDRDSTVLSLTAVRFSMDGFDVMGSFKLTMPDKELELRLSTSPVKAAELKELIPPEALPQRLRETMDGVAGLRGSLTIDDLKFSNSVKDASGKTDYLRALTLEMAFSDIGFTHSNFKGAFSGLKGRISYKDGTAEISDTRGSYGRSTIEKLDARIDAATAHTRATLDATLDAGQLLDELGEMAGFTPPKGLSAKGAVRLNLSCNGVPPGLKGENDGEGIVIKSSMDLTPAAVGYGDTFKKPAGYPARIGGELTVTPKKVATERTVVEFGESTLHAAMLLSLKDPFYRVRIASKDVRIEDAVQLSPLFVKGSPSQGTVKIEFTVEGRGRRAGPAYKGRLQVEDGLFKSTLFAKSVRDVYAVAEIDGKSGKILLESMKIGKSSLSGRIDMIDTEKGIIDFNLLSERFNTEDIFPSRFKPGTGKAPLNLTGRGKITIRQGTLHKTSFRNLSAEITINRDKVLIEPLSFTSNNGRISGKIACFRGNRSLNIIESEFKVSMMEAGTFIRELGASKDIISGRLMAEARLDIRRGARPATAGLNGEIRVLSKDGTLWKFIVISKIFSIVNIISINQLFEEGLPYKTLSGTFSIKDGIISTEDLLLTSDSLRMSAVGRIDLTKGTIDSVLALHPFVTIDKIITNIPLAGWIIGGEERSTITMYYEIKGPLARPEVNAIPVKGMGKKVFGIFQRILQAPAKAVEPLMRELQEEEEEKR